MNKGWSGQRFKSLASKVASSYRAKGYSPARANAIGQATAGKQFWHKYGTRSGSWILKRER